MYDDEFNGMGGSYILDPKTGLRTRVEEPATPTAAPEVGAATPDVSPATVSGKKSPLTPKTGV